MCSVQFSFFYSIFCVWFWGAQIGVTPLECTERRFAPQSHNRLLAGKDEANAHGQEKSRLG